MRTAAFILVWLKRGLLIGGLVFVAVFALLYFKSASIVEAIVLPRLEARGGQLELESIRVSFSGAELQVKHYEEANLRVEGLSVICPWNQLWSIGEGFAGTVHVDAVRVQLSEATGAGAEADQSEPAEMAPSPEARVAEWAGLVDALAIVSVDVVIDDLLVEADGQQVHCGLDVSLLRGVSGATHVAACLKSRGVDLDARVKVLAEGAGLSLDFTLSASDWDDFQASYLQTVSPQWAQAGGEIYVNSLGDGRGFLDASGYARWLQTEPERLSYCVLADLGAVEVYGPTGEIILQNAAAGLACDGSGHVRSYVKGAVDSLRVGSWMESGGDWALRVDNQTLAGELRFGESISLSLAHDDWSQLLQGAGAGRFYLEAGAVDAELLRALELPGVPDDLTVDMGLRVEGEGVFAEWQPVTVQVKVDATVREAELTMTGVSVVNAQAQIDLNALGTSIESGTLDLSVEDLDLLGFGFDQLNVEMSANADGLLALQPIRVGFLGGELLIDAMEVDPSELEGFTFRIGLKAVDLAQLATAVPQFKGDVTGKVSGHLVGEFKSGQPVLTDGRLEIDSEQGARLHYDVTGLLTRGMAVDSASYKQYRMAELAFEDLALKRFSIDVFPDGNATRPFRLELFGESLQGKTVVPVDFNLNVNVDDTAGVLELLRMIQRGELEF